VSIDLGSKKLIARLNFVLAPIAPSRLRSRLMITLANHAFN